MVTRASSIRCVVVVVAAAAAVVLFGWPASPRASAAALDCGFQGGRFDNDALLLFGRNSDQLVKPTTRGLLVRIPPKGGDQGAVGIALQPRIRGDFEITASYQLLDFATPPAGAGVRVKLTTELANPTKDRVTIERAAIPKEGNVCTSTVTVGTSGKGRHSSFVRRPVLARAGRLRVSRAGSLMKLDYTDDAGKFRTLREINLGDADTSRVTLVLDTDRSAQGAAILVKELTLSATTLHLPADPPVESIRWGLMAAVAANAALIVALGVGISVVIDRLRQGQTRQAARLRARAAVEEGTSP